MDDDSDNLSNDSFELKEKRPSYKPIVLGLLLAIFVLQVLYTVYRRRANQEQPSAAVISIDIAALPEGAEIFLDGKPVGVSNVHQEISPGNHEVLVRLAGYESKKESLTLSQSQSIRVELEPIAMDLLVQTPERMAEIWIDEEPQGSFTDEIIIRGILPGIHTVRIKASSEEAITSFDFQPGALPVPAMEGTRPTILFLAGFLGKGMSECNCTAQLQLDGAAQSLEPGKGLEFALPEGKYAGEFRDQGKGKTVTFEMGSRPTATLAVFWPAKPASKPRPLDTQSLLNTALTQISNSKCDAAELTVAQILRPEPDNADAIALQRRIARLRSVGGCQ